MPEPPKDTRRPNNCESEQNLITPRIIIVCVCLAVAIAVAVIIHTYRTEQKAIKQMQKRTLRKHIPPVLCVLPVVNAKERK